MSLSHGLELQTTEYLRHRSIALVITLSQNRRAVLNFLIRTTNCHTENCSNIRRRLGMARNNIREMVAEPCRSTWRRETTASSIYDGL